MAERLTDERRHARNKCEVRAECRKAGDQSWSTIQLDNISDGGVGFLSNTWFIPGQTVEVRFTPLRVSEPVQCTIRWFMKPEKDGEPALHGAQVLPTCARKHFLIVETLRHIEAWREVNQHLTHRSISSSEAIDQWLADHGSVIRAP